VAAAAMDSAAIIVIFMVSSFSGRCLGSGVP
jgi:hypothetical protein